MRELVARTGLFSPPYGDSTILDYMGVPTKMFSPPYGDGTKKIR